MSRKFIAAIVAGSIAITGFSAAHANASDRNLKRFVVGAAALAILGAAINEGSRSRTDTVSRSHNDNWTDPNARIRHNKVERHNKRNNRNHHHKHTSQNDRARMQPHDEILPTPRPLPERVRRAELPDRCLKSYNTNQGAVRMYGRTCLQRHYRHVGSLSSQCKQRLRSSHGPVFGYNAHCLRRMGQIHGATAYGADVNAWLNKG